MTQDRKAQLRIAAANKTVMPKDLEEALDYIAELETELMRICAPVRYTRAVQDQIDRVIGEG